MLASQSSPLRLHLEAIPGIPIIHFNPRGVLVLSPPSRATLKHKDAQEEERRLEGASLVKDVVDGGNVVGASTSITSQPPRNRAKGPNPLSMRKKKTSSAGERERENKAHEHVEEAAKKRKKRKRSQKGAVKEAIAEINGIYAQRTTSNVESEDE